MPTPTGRRGARHRLDRRGDAARPRRRPAPSSSTSSTPSTATSSATAAPAGSAPRVPRPQASEWVRRLSFVQGSTRESLHPNAYGQRAIGACIGLLYAQPRGDYACRDTPGRSYVGGMRIEPLG